MNKMTKMFCHYVMYLNWIPRYGRYYTFLSEEERTDDKWHGPAQWAWRKHGWWGMNILDRMGLMWKYIDETNPELKEWRNENDGALE